MISLAVAAAGWVGVSSPGDYAAVQFPPLPRHNLFGTDEVLVAARQLCQLPGIDIAQDVDEVTYVHFMCDDHQIVYANGAETETMLAGDEALIAVGPAARAEIDAIFPELSRTPPVPSRAVLSGRMGRQLAVRHLRNNHPLVS